MHTMVSGLMLPGNHCHRTMQHCNAAEEAFATRFINIKLFIKDKSKYINYGLQLQQETF